jgi:hypothetical protein
MCTLDAVLALRSAHGRRFLGKFVGDNSVVSGKLIDQLFITSLGLSKNRL